MSYLENKRFFFILIIVQNTYVNIILSHLFSKCCTVTISISNITNLILIVLHQ